MLRYIDWIHSISYSSFKFPPTYLFQVEFDDVLAEPEGARSADCVWRNTYKCFNCGRNLCYKILTFLCGICLGLFWGCVFACVSFKAIWCCGPYLRCLHIILHPIRKVHAIILSSKKSILIFRDSLMADLFNFEISKPTNLQILSF